MNTFLYLSSPGMPRGPPGSVERSPATGLSPREHHCTPSPNAAQEAIGQHQFSYPRAMAGKGPYLYLKKSPNIGLTLGDPRNLGRDLLFSLNSKISGHPAFELLFDQNVALPKEDLQSLL